jgi:hypothetical protein
MNPRSGWRRRKRRQLTSLSTPFGGVGWKTDPGDADVIRKLLIQLSEKRVLSDDLDSEYEGRVNRAVLEIRSWLTEALTQLREDTDSYTAVARMRNACKTYLTKAHDPITTPFTHLRPHFRESLLELRLVFRANLQDIHTELRLDAATELAGQIPSTVREFPQVAPGPTRTIYIEPPERFRDDE